MAKAKKKAKSKPVKKAAKKIVKRVAKKVTKRSMGSRVVPNQKASKPVVKKAKSATDIRKTIPSEFHPVRDRILVQRDVEKTRTSGGLYIPDAATEKPAQGRVLAVGTGSFTKKGKFKPLTIEVGDRVMFSKYAGQEIHLNGDEYIVLQEADVIGFVE